MGIRILYIKFHPRTDHEGPEVEFGYSSTLSLTSALDGVGGQRHALAALSPGITRYPLHRRVGGPKSLSGRVWKISPLPGFDPPTELSRPIEFYKKRLFFDNVWLWASHDILCSPTERFFFRCSLLLSSQFF